VKATRVWGQLTGRAVTPKVAEWIQRLADERGGDERVASTIERLALTVPPEKLLGAVSDALARADLATRAQPRELTRDELMAWARDDIAPAELPVIYDIGRMALQPDEVLLIEEWVARGRRPAPRVEAVA
jgi:hypothetical protein